MATVTQGSEHVPQTDVEGPIVEFKGINYKERYPNGLDLTPGSEDHQRIVARVLSMARAGKDVMSKRYDVFKKIDRSLTVYVKPETKKNAREDDKKTIPVIVPESYGVLEILMTYMVAAFLADNPIFKYMAGGDDLIGAALLELIVDKQVQYNKVALNLYTMWRDAYAYGIGIACPIWKTHEGHRIRMIGGERVAVPETLFEGNALVNIHPTRFIPDPSVALHEIQDGEFVGYLNLTNKLKLIKEERLNDNYFNCQHIRAKGQRSSMGQEDYYDKEYIRKGEENAANYSSPVDELVMLVDLIPSSSDWQLSDSENVERWEFRIANDLTIIGAGPIELAHNRFPIVTCSPSMDGYSVSPISRIEIGQGTQDLIDFLITTHASALTRGVNNMFLVDPQLVYTPDFEAAAEGGLVRLRRSAWGRGIKDVLEQIPVNDVTVNNMVDMQMLRGMMQQHSNATDTVQGVRRRGSERVSASEYRGDRSSALSRLEKDALLISIQSHTDLARFFGWHTQQFMSQDSFVKLAGRHEEQLVSIYGGNIKGYARVSPENLLIPFEVQVGDGTVPSGEFADVLMTAFQIIAGNQELTATFDIPRFFTRIMRSMNIRNAEEFLRKGGQVQATVAPDAQVEQAANEGTIEPLPGGGY